MERHSRTVITLFSGAEPLAPATEVRLAGDPARHAHVRRVERGDPVRLLDGRGRVASGQLVEIGKDEVRVSIEQVNEVPRPTPLQVIVPVADRERMLLAAEKCVELQVTAWRPVYFARSRSVSPRGEGPKFREKLIARMQSALEQSGGAWLPDVEAESDAADALTSGASEWNRLLLDLGGQPISNLAGSVPTVIAVGPEGGLERDEIAIATASGWVFASLGTTTLRFETAIIAAAAVIRATQLTHRSS